MHRAKGQRSKKTQQGRKRGNKETIPNSPIAEDVSTMVKEETPFILDSSILQPVEGTTIMNSTQGSSQPEKSMANGIIKRQRTCKCNCVKKHQLGSPHEEAVERRQSQRLQIKNYKLPFEHLPRECKIHVFSYLTIFERGRAAQVCSEWRALLQLPGVWSNVNLSVFNMSKPKPSAGRHRNRGCAACRHYQTYVRKVALFMQYLQGVRPSLKRLFLSLDFGSKKNKWDKALLQFLTNSRCSELTHVNLDWCQDLQKPACFDSFCCHFNKARTLFKLHTERRLVFEDFFDQFSRLTPKLRHLAVPFPWTWRNVRYLCRLTQLEQLTLDQYSVFRCPEQAMLDMILCNMPDLKVLKLVVSMPFYRHNKVYTVSHPSLEILDISQCQGFFLSQLELPSLRVIRISRAPWQGALRQPNRLPCIKNLLLGGSTSVTHINKFQLDNYWKEYEYEEMKLHLDKVCPCFRHAIEW